jgi:KaiC/GvpD/RAD55 family RecA-like ATPase
MTGLPCLDAAIGGFSEGSSVLVHGATGVGKTLFAFGFLQEGLLRGEPCAVATTAPPKALLAHARSFGMDLEPYLRSKQLLLVEVLAGEHDMRRMIDDGEILGQLRDLLAGHASRRLVIDPVTAIVAARSMPDTILRSHDLVRMVDALNTCCLYLLNSQTYGDLAAAWSSLIGPQISLAKEPGEGQLTKLTASGFSSTYAGRVELPLLLARGVGFVPMQQGGFPGRPEPQEAAPQARCAAAPRAQLLPWPAPIPSQPPETASAISTSAPRSSPTVLMIHPEADRRAQLKSILEPECAIVEAQGAADGLSSVFSCNPSVIIMAAQMHGISGIEITRKLRRLGRRTPIIILGSKLRRVQDEIAALKAGADACYDNGLNPELLKLRVLGMLRRDGAGSPSGWPDETGQEYQRVRSPEMVCTTDFEVFQRCLAEETERARTLGSEYTVLLARQSRASYPFDGLAGLLAMMVRACDTVYVGPSAVVVLLADTSDPGPFIQRVRREYQSPESPLIEVLEIDEKWDSAANVALKVQRATGASAAKPERNSVESNIPVLRRLSEA